MAGLAFLIACVLVSIARFAHGQSSDQNLSHHPWFIGSSLFILTNAAPIDDPLSFYQLNVGRWLTPTDVISIEVITWRYHHPLNAPPAFKALDDKWPWYFLGEPGLHFGVKF